MSQKSLFILGGFLLIGAILRLYKLDSLPPSLEWDEVATGYDAYSILKTGRDQYGYAIPLSFRSIDDYKPPLYTYLTAVSIAILGWNDFAVRFPAALLGTLSILTTYVMVKEMLGKEKLALLSAFFLSISPWHINFSRLALETNSTIFFTTAGVWAFLKGRHRGFFLVISAILFGLDLYLYHNARVFVPILTFVLLCLYIKDVWRQKTYALIAFFISCIFVFRLIPIVTSVEGQMRFAGTSIFTPAVPLDIAATKSLYDRLRNYDDKYGISVYGKLFHNQYVMWGLMIFRNYLTHFSPGFWIFTDDYERHHMPQMGILYFIDILFLYTGIYFLAKNPHKKNLLVLLVWILTAPIPSAVTRDVPHALRSAIFMPIFQVLIAGGVLGLGQLFARYQIRRIAYTLLVIFGYVICVSFFLHKFLFHFARETSSEWQYGREEAALFTDKVKDQYERILVSIRLQQPYIFWLYYLKYDPVKYLKEGGTVSGSWEEERNKFANFEFTTFDYATMQDGRTLFVGLPNEFLPGTQKLKTIYDLDGKEAIWIVEG